MTNRRDIIVYNPKTGILMKRFNCLSRMTPNTHTFINRNTSFLRVVSQEEAERIEEVSAAMRVLERQRLYMKHRKPFTDITQENFDFSKCIQLRRSPSFYPNRTQRDTVKKNSIELGDTEGGRYPASYYQKEPRSLYEDLYTMIQKSLDEPE